MAVFHLGMAENTQELAQFYPTSVLVTGFDIIFFWVAWMVMMGLYFQEGKLPVAKCMSWSDPRCSRAEDVQDQRQCARSDDLIDGIDLEAL